MKFTYRTLAVAVAAALVVPTQATFAQDENLTEEVVVIGTRTEGRSALDSPAPVDVIGGETMSNQGDTDMSNLLRNVVPSYNVNDQPISDGNAGSPRQPARPGTGSHFDAGQRQATPPRLGHYLAR